MPSDNQKSIVAYCSPAGTTEHVAKVIARKLESLGVDVMVLTLGRPFDLSPIFSEIEAGREHLSLYVGSPVYAYNTSSCLLMILTEYHSRFL